MKFIVYDSAHTPARPSKRDPSVTLPASTWALLSRYGQNAETEAALGAINLARYGAERLSSFVDLARLDAKGHLVPAEPVHDGSLAKELRHCDAIIDVTEIFPRGINEIDEPVLDDDGNPVLDGQGKPTTRKVRELRLRLLVA